MEEKIEEMRIKISRMSKMERGMRWVRVRHKVEKNQVNEEEKKEEVHRNSVKRQRREASLI